MMTPRPWQTDRNAERGLQRLGAAESGAVVKRRYIPRGAWWS